MREFASYGRLLGIVPPMRCLPLAMLTILAGCNSPAFLEWEEEQAQYASMGSDSSGDVVATTDDAELESTGTLGSDDAGVATTDPADTSPPTGTASDAGDATDSAPAGDAEKPTIVSVDLPANVYAAGPVPLAVQADHTAKVRILRNGVDAGELLAAGGGLFTGELPVRGAVDNGEHEVEVIATQGEHEDRRTAFYDVSTPKPGAEAWTLDGPAESRTHRVAVTPARHLVEVGRTVIDGVPVPTLRMRSSLTGAQLGPEKLLDTREGAAVDVAVRADGRMWVAMNVREPGKDSRARIVLLDAEGNATGIEVLGAAGRVIRAIAADAEGGCFAVGVAGVMGDWDIAYWRLDAAGVQSLGETYDYDPNDKPHSFADLANDVVIDGDVAYVIGTSTGKHANLTPRMRGMIVAMDLQTGDIVAPVVIAPMLDLWTQSAFFGAALHPDGVLVTGYGSDDANSTYRIETAIYSAAGLRTWHRPEKATDQLSYGSDVVLDSQGRVLVAGAVTKDGKLRGYVFGRTTDGGDVLLLEHWFKGAGPSEALGIAVDSFDRIFPAGYITANGSEQAQIVRIHG